MKKWLAPIFGFIPFVYGVLATYSTNILPPEAAFIMGPVLAAAFLLMWNRLAKIANFHICNDKKTILFMHIPGILVFTILCMNAAAQEPFLFGWFRDLLLYYLMPVLPLSLLISISCRMCTLSMLSPWCLCFAPPIWAATASAAM